MKLYLLVMQMYSAYDDAFHIDNISSIADCIFVCVDGQPGSSSRENDEKFYFQKEASVFCL